VAASVGDISSVREVLAGGEAELAGATSNALAHGFSIAHGVSLVIMVVAAWMARSLARGPSHGTSA
jgi:chromosome condensin MukBEF ATPase and DNA-binding subunit MukB